MCRNSGPFTLILKICLVERRNYREGEKGKYRLRGQASANIPQMAAVADPELSFTTWGLSHGSGPKDLGRPLLPSQSHEQELDEKLRSQDSSCCL